MDGTDLTSRAVPLEMTPEEFQNAVVAGTFALRACIVNFRTTLAALEVVPGVVARCGEAVDRALRPSTLAGR